MRKIYKRTCPNCPELEAQPTDVKDCPKCGAPYPKLRRGFGAMSPEALSKIASLGGFAAQGSGKAHRWTPEEAKEAWKKSADVRRKDMA